MIKNKEKNQRRLAEGLGWFSIGLGLAEIVAPRRMAKMIGVKSRPSLFRLMGLREVASGVGILTRPRPDAWLWSRLAGDAIDLGLLGAALGRSRKSQRRKIMAVIGAVAGVAALDIFCRKQLGGIRKPLGKIHVVKSITINRSPEDLYEFWRHFDQLPLFMDHLESVEVIGEKRSRWVAKAPAGMHVEWDAEIINQVPNALIAWRSLEGADVDNSGSVRFEKTPSNRGTVVKVELEYCPPGGAAGARIAKLFGDAPDQQIAVDLRRFKQLMETGEIARTEGQSAGRTSSTSKKYDNSVRS